MCKMSVIHNRENFKAEGIRRRGGCLSGQWPGCVCLEPIAKLNGKDTIQFHF